MGMCYLLVSGGGYLRTPGAREGTGMQVSCVALEDGQEDKGDANSASEPELREGAVILSPLGTCLADCVILHLLLGTQEQTCSRSGCLSEQILLTLSCQAHFHMHCGETSSHLERSSSGPALPRPRAGSLSCKCGGPQGSILPAFPVTCGGLEHDCCKGR